MKTYIAILITAVMLIGCHMQKRATVTTHNNITIVDLLTPGVTLLEYDSLQREARYPVYYVGAVKDTIEINKPLSLWDRERHDTVHPYATNISNLKLVVDTAIPTSHNIHKYNTDNYLVQTDRVQSGMAYPAFIYNTSDSFIYLGEYNLLLNIVRQAKNNKGQWLDIENPADFFCGYGARQIIAGPHQMIVAKLLRYKGDYFTECRLKCGRRGRYLYSNSFYDYIDKRQLTDTLDPYW